MNSGEVVEIGEPRKLKVRSGSYFRALVDASSGSVEKSDLGNVDDE